MGQNLLTQPGFCSPKVVQEHIRIRISDYQIVSDILHVKKNVRRGGYKTGGGASEILLLQKGGGAQICLAILKGGTKRFQVVLKWELKV